MAPSSPNFSDATTAIAIPCAGRISGDESQYEIAERAANAVLLAESATPAFAICARLGLGLIAIRRGDVSEAHRLYQAVESQVEASGLFTNFSTGRFLELLAHTMGDWNLAATYFETAVDSCRGGGQKPELAWSCYEYADMLLERNGEGDKAKAKGLLDESLAVSTDLGMRPLMERVLSR